MVDRVTLVVGVEAHSHHRYRGQTHRERGNKGAQQPTGQRVEHTGSDRNPEGVVAEREEQVLSDVAHRGLTHADHREAYESVQNSVHSPHEMPQKNR